MAKLTYVNLVNRVLTRITQPSVTTVVGITGQGLIISQMINEAQNELWSETTNWYELFTQRNFTTLVDGNNTTLTFHATTPATITDSISGFSPLLVVGQTIRVLGSQYNDGVYILSPTVAPTAGTLTLQPADTLVAETPSTNVITIYVLTYPVAANFGRAYHLVDVTNNRILTEDSTRAFAIDDPQMQQADDPTHFSMQGDFYRLYYIPSGVFQMTDRYWQYPAPLVLDTDTSILPLFCENFLIHWAWMSICRYMNKFDLGDRLEAQIYGNPTKPSQIGILTKAMTANSKILDKMIRFQPHGMGRAIAPPRFPWPYGSQ